MNSFKDIAYQILKEANKPLHSEEITKIALKRGLRSIGKTPEKTMEAIISVDIKVNGKKSRFVRTAKSIFFINLNWKLSFDKKYKISKTLSSKQKGDIAENRIAEIIMLYGNKLSCYKPISDDEGIDLIVKKKETKDVFFIQVKSIWRERGVVVATVKRDSVLGKKNLGIVFCVFNTEDAEMGDLLWFIPANKFIKKAGFNKKYKRYVFVAGRNKRESNKWDQYLIDKRSLANTVINQMKIT